jgi:tetratricopeptide (TPR) repeat protein
MNEPHDAKGTVDVPSTRADSKDAPLAGDIGAPQSNMGARARAADPLQTTDHVAGAASTDESASDADAPRSDLPEVPGYRVLREIARGGMGRVLAAYDFTLDRDVALKMLLPGANADRFVRESKITARLPHPGIPPVHSLGTLADGSPFLAMKLIGGRTLAEVMKTADRPRLLQVFLQVCQAVGFAHSRGILHRDLKPANVMVGAFGEVQVMDWGLAKNIDPPKGERERLERDPPPRTPNRSDPNRTTDNQSIGESLDDRTQAGQVLGTPAYMAPEQARGEATDARADVFALGGILCAILTNQPPFAGKTAREVIRRASAANLADAFAALDECGADAELVALCRSCLSPSPPDRPVNAQAVADALTAYLNGVQEKLRRAELAGVEERARRRLTTVVAASLLALFIVGGLGFTYWLHQRMARLARGALALNEATLLRDQALDLPDDPDRWEAALESLKRAETVLAEGGNSGARQQLATLGAEVRAGAQAAQRTHMLLGELIDIRSAKADDPDGSATDAAYADAFQAVGVKVDEDDPQAAAARIAARLEPVRGALVAALDHWTAVRKSRKAGGDAWPRLVAVARAADPDPDRDALRAALAVDNKAQRLEQIRPLAARAEASTWSPASLVLLANTLAEAEDVEAGVRLLRRASGIYPTDVWVNYELGRLLGRMRPPRRDEAIEAYSAARALRPELAHELAHALADRGRSEQAEAVFRDLVGRRPRDARHLGCLAQHLQGQRRAAEAGPFLERAIAAGREAIRLRPNDAVAHANLTLALNANGQFDEASAIARQAIALDPQDAVAHDSLGVTLKNRGLLNEAIDSFRAAIALDPQDASLHGHLGDALEKTGQVDEAIVCYHQAVALDPQDAAAHNRLGLALAGDGQLDDAVACYHKALEVDPKHAPAHLNLGNVLKGKGRLDEAIACYHKALEVDPQYAPAHLNLGNALYGRGQMDEAIDCFLKAIAFDPIDAGGHNSLGVAQLTKGWSDEAIASFRRAIALDPKFAPAVLNLGEALQRKGEIDEAVACYQRAIDLDPKSAKAHDKLGVVLMNKGQLDEAIAHFQEAIALDPNDTAAHDNLGNAHFGKGQMEEAVACFKQAIEIDPTNAMAHNNLGSVLARMGRVDDGIAYFHKAIALDPKNALAHVNLGNALYGRGQMDQAIACYKQAIEVDPKSAEAHYRLGNSLMEKGLMDQAIACYEQAIEVAPNFAEAHCNLGNALKNQGRFAESLAAFRRGHELGTMRPGWPYPSAQWLREAEARATLESKLHAFRKGEWEPENTAERIGLVGVCRFKKLHDVAARLYADALADDPKLADDPMSRHRYIAACFAALAAAGQGEDATGLDDAARAKLRRQALDWLQAELTAWSKLLDVGEQQARTAIVETLSHWQQDSDLAGLRDADALAKLPAEEQKEFSQLWDVVAALLKKAEEDAK